MQKLLLVIKFTFVIFKFKKFILLITFSLQKFLKNFSNTRTYSLCLKGALCLFRPKFSEVLKTGLKILRIESDRA